MSRNRNGDRPIIVDFITNSHKVSTLQAVRKYNSSNPTNRLNTSVLSIEGKKSPIYVSEFLYPKLKTLTRIKKQTSSLIEAKQPQNFKYHSHSNDPHTCI